MNRKKRSIIISLLIILILTSSITVNASSMNMIIENKLSKVRPTPIMINDKMMYSAFPSFIHKDQTYVPLRFIFELLGAKITWNEQDSSLVIENNEDSLVLFANQSFASINNEMVILDNSSKPIIASIPNNEYGHTMIPLVFVADFLNCDVGYNIEKNIPYINIKSISNKNSVLNNNINEINTVEIINDYLFIEGANNVDYQLITLDNPSRIVLDIKGSVLKGRKAFNLNESFIYIKNVRGSQFTTSKLNPSENIVRIVLDLKTNSNLFYLDIVQSGENLKIYPKIR